MSGNWAHTKVHMELLNEVVSDFVVSSRQNKVHIRWHLTNKINGPSSGLGLSMNSSTSANRTEIIVGYKTLARRARARAAAAARQ